MTGQGVAPGTHGTLFYRRLASPLHATRAGVGAAWTAVLVVVAFASDHPLVLGVLALSIVAAGACAGVGRTLARSLRTAVIVALPIVVVNVIVARDGLTVFARLGDLGPFGQGNLTVEALVYGTVIALKVTIMMLASTLASLAVDPDELLRVVRRISFRSALTASLATRMIPLLAVDARRLAEAQLTRPERPPASGRPGRGKGRSRARVRLLGAVFSSSLDRAMDVAATLELRGFATASRAPRRRVPWSRHDLAFLASGVSVAAIAVVARLDGIAKFDAYPEVHTGALGGVVALAGGLAFAVLAPFCDRRGIEP